MSFVETVRSFHMATIFTVQLLQLETKLFEHMWATNNHPNYL